MSARRLLAAACYVAAGLLGLFVALATAGCGGGGSGALSTAITHTIPNVTRPATTSPPEGETETTVTFGTTIEVPETPAATVTETFPAATETLPARTVTVTQTEAPPVIAETMPATTETLPAFPDSPWTVEELVASTAVVLWIAHLYTHGLSESISEGRRLNGARVWSLAVRELGILLAAVPPTLALTLGALGLFDETASIWLALGLGLAILAVEGVRYARIEGLGSAAKLMAVAVNAGLGLLV